MPGSTVSVFGEPDDYQAALRHDAELDFLIAGRGEFRSQLTRISLPHLTLSAGTEFLARIAVITVASDSVRISLPAHRGSSLFWGGRPSRLGEIVTHRSAKRVFERTEGPCRWRIICLSDKDLTMYGRAVSGAAFEVPPGECRWRPTARALTSLTGLHDDAIRATTAQSDVAADAQAASGLEQQLIHLLIECLLAGQADESAAARSQQADIMTRFEDHSRAGANWAFALSEICAALGVPDRTLRAHCQAYLGMAPKRYLHLRRLQLARRALRSVDPEGSSVSEVARRYGFDGLGRFAADYLEQYGELPSITLRDSTAV